MLNTVGMKERQLWFLLQWLDELAYYGCDLGLICIYAVPGGKLKPSYTASLGCNMEKLDFPQWDVSMCRNANFAQLLHANNHLQTAASLPPKLVLYFLLLISQHGLSLRF